MGFVDVISVNKNDQTVYKMPVKVEISESALAKMKTYKEGQSGSMMSTWPTEKIITILSCFDGPDENDLEHHLHCPGGVTFWGTFLITQDHSNCEIIHDRLSLAVSRNSVTGELLATYVDGMGRVESYVKVVVRTLAELASNFFIARCRATIPFSSMLAAKPLEDAVHEVIKRVQVSRFLELKRGMYDKPLEALNKKTECFSLKDMEVVEITLLEHLCVPFAERRALLIDYKRKTVKAIWMDLCVDAVSMCRRTETVETLSKHISSSIVNNLLLQKRCMMNQIEKNEPVGQPEVFHFLVDHLMTVAYPKNKLDRDLEHIRAQIHERYFLPKDRPLLMRGNALTFADEQAGTELINVHESVGRSDVPGGEPVVVQGRYAYHHYCQQGMDDSGWGCAYRSLQTLFSWFKLQGYTNRPVPSLKEIQQCLVQIGDKPSSFIGSSQWIGSTEVGFCLDTMLGVASRFSSVSSGDEMSMKGGELSHHFKTQGTPVMIGGGNLAHTILGVDYNKKTGEIKFLVLDPHYTGTDDLDKIIAKGWCGWKGINFWKKGSFYNMCMPIRPRCI